jgi:cyclic dehypoxanthinyl futalosine synthase
LALLQTAVLKGEGMNLVEKIIRGERISEDEALELLKDFDLLTLGQIANYVRNRIHPEREVTFVIDRNINYTNICICKCRFCAFYRERELLMPTL